MAMPLDEPPPFRYRQPRIEGVEDVENYCPGGYHPVEIGEIIPSDDQAYQVIHKLGHGGFSTVWLVQTQQHEPSYFALKILRADVVDVPELRLLEYLRKVAGPGHPNLVALHDSFKISGPNGEHQCLVFPFLGPSLRNSKTLATLSGSARHGICQQVASAVEFLHRNGICHGDLTASNVLFELPHAQTLSPACITQLLGPTESERLRPPSSHAPRRVYQSPNFSGLDICSLTQVRIVDFGQAFMADQPPTSLGIPLDFFPPELCFGYLPSTKSDIWHLACLIYQAHSDTIMFPTFFHMFEMLVGTVIDNLGPLPEHWKGRYDFAEYGYVEPGKPPSTVEPAWWFEPDHERSARIDTRLAREAPHLSPNQRQEYVRLIHEMTAYEPEERLSAAEVMRRLRSDRFADKSENEGPEGIAHP
ncbi:hypothetical protein HIM_09545 [Hirsutella minnesotensis 3608]|uniref:EKC/KEOPS complex subunit BUD32 n=1 Tax=Hirsutella minnesotensis 3608 TaxID=1043627 RepID=A0A0F7ZSB5_9HYPO|nr:hypothetical protein HIM_09545 [Hirsutella minnesotensis 3608]